MLYAVKRIAAKLSYHYVKAGNFVYREGHVPAGYYMIIHGTVALKQKQTKLVGGPSRNFKFLPGGGGGKSSSPVGRAYTSTGKTTGTVVKKTL